MSDPKEVQETDGITNSMEWPIDPSDTLLVYLNGKLQSMVMVADVEKGYLVRRTWDGCKVTFKGDIKISYNGMEAARAELDLTGLESRN